MTADLGVFSPLVATAGTLTAAASALYLGFKGRAPWEPVEEDIPRGAQKGAGLVIAVALALIWYWFWIKNPNQGSALTGWAISLAVTTIIFLLLYSFLVGWLTYDKVTAVGPNNTASKKIIGAFVLTPRAKELKQQGHTVQEVLAGAAYEEDLVWPRFARATTKAIFQLVYIVLVAAGTSALTIAAVLVSVQPAGSALPQAMEKWIQDAEAAQEAGTVTGSSPLPTSLIEARSAFESAWQNSGLAARRELDQDKLSKALSYVNRLYRLQEKDSPTKRTSLSWADTAIRHFEEVQDRKHLTLAMLDKAAIYLDMSQLANNNKEDFKKASEAGDSIIARAIEIADHSVKDQALRFSSRFYYDLARPRTFRLSDVWDNNYLLLAYARAEEARKLAPNDIKNANQLVRSAMRASKNPPQDSDKLWGQKLRDAKAAMKVAWEKNNDRLRTIDERLSPLNVLGTATLETVARDWHSASSGQRASLAKTLLSEIETDGLVLLREAEALLQNAELKRSNGFDIYYDISRCYAQRVVMLRSTDKSRAAKEFGEVTRNLSRAREFANSNQLDAAAKDIEADLSFSKLSTQEKTQLTRLIRSGPR